jgi:hypothetical protein
MSYRVMNQPRAERDIWAAPQWIEDRSKSAAKALRWVRGIRAKIDTLKANHLALMQTYSERTGRQPAFEVHYRFLTPTEGGRISSPRQHVRWDFMYACDDPLRDGISMIWPEFIDASGAVLPEGEVPCEGQALMFIVNLDRVPFHKERIAPGVRGFLMEGSRKVAECEVTRVLGLARNDA